MSSVNGSEGAELPSDQSFGATLSTQLFESLCYVLIEKGVLTKNDAMSVVQTVAQVKRGSVVDGSPTIEEAAELLLLRQLFTSFEALDDRPTDVGFSAENVHRLRPPLHEDRPEFPENDD